MEIIDRNIINMFIFSSVWFYNFFFTFQYNHGFKLELPDVEDISDPYSGQKKKYIQVGMHSFR